MSPIGRVFIVLNLLLAGTFVGFSGTYLQKQHNYKTKLEAEVAARAEDKKSFEAEKVRLENERNAFEVAKTSAETKLGETKNALDTTNDENKRLNAQLSSMEGDLKQVNASLATANAQAKAAFDQSDAAYKMAIADQKVKYDAVRAKDSAEAENRNLKTTIASLEDTVKGKDLNLAALSKEINEQKLLVSVAVQNGFVPALAGPTLGGTVSHVVNDRLCTISITNNPGNVDIADQIAKRQFSFAIYDASGYKGEAIATAYHPADKMVTCNLMVVKGGSIKEGDMAATKTP